MRRFALTWIAITVCLFLGMMAGLAAGPLKREFRGDRIKEPGVAIVSCNDGLRPVIMKLEATDEEVKIEYTPIDR